MTLRTTLFAAFTLVVMIIAGSTESHAQNSCTTPSMSVAAAIDTILYLTDQPDFPTSITANIDSGVGPMSQVFQANGTGSITVTGTGRLESATVNGVTVCHGSSGAVVMPSGKTATLTVNTSPQGRPYISLIVNELQ